MSTPSEIPPLVGSIAAGDSQTAAMLPTRGGISDGVDIVGLVILVTSIEGPDHG